MSMKWAKGLKFEKLTLAKLGILKKLSCSSFIFEESEYYSVDQQKKYKTT